MPSVDINWWAVIAATVINMMVGGLWYSKNLFGQEWATLTGGKLDDITGGKVYGLLAVGALVQTFVLVHFVRYAGSTTFWKGLVTGFWLWLGFMAVIIAARVVVEKKPWAEWKIYAGYYFVVMLINGGLLAAWR